MSLSPRISTVFAITVAAVGLATVVGCQQTAPNGGASLMVVASGDTGGWIVPCGCNTTQSGGLLRRGTLIASLKEKGKVIYVDVGGAGQGGSPYDRAKFEAIIDGEMAMGLAAHNLGLPELALGLDYLREVAEKKRAPWLSCNVRDRGGNLAAEPVRIQVVGGRRVALVGVVSEKGAREGIVIDPPRESILMALGERRGQYDSAIVLAYLEQAPLEELAASLPEVDVVIGGPTGQSIVPRQIGPTTLVSVTNKGKFLAVLDAPTGGGASWSGRVLEVSDEWSDDVRQKENLKTFHAALARFDFTASQTSFVQPLPGTTPASYQIAGSRRCRECHEPDCAVWDESLHASAWLSLTLSGSHVDSYCQQCHTTGYGLPGGFVSAGSSGDRTNVGCESCHGPSLGHADDPTMRTAVGTQAAGQCLRCHDPENSPDFDYAKYWEEMKHGSSS